MTATQAKAAGLTRDQLSALIVHGWRRPTRGVYISPGAQDPFRASLRAALLIRADASFSHVTASRVHHLAGLPRWTPGEWPHLILPAGQTFNKCNGLVLHTGLRPGEQIARDGLPVTSLARTVFDMGTVLALDDLVCLVDSALRAGFRMEPEAERMPKRLRAALALADGRSESALETLVRLSLVRAGLAPEALQYKVFGSEYHDLPEALHRDRVRANKLADDGWKIFRCTWDDRVNHPERITALIRNALYPEARVIRAS